MKEIRFEPGLNYGVIQGTYIFYECTSEDGEGKLYDQSLLLGRKQSDGLRCSGFYLDDILCTLLLLYNRAVNLRDSAESVFSYSRRLGSEQVSTI